MLSAHCGPNSTCTNKLLTKSLLGDDIGDIAPHDIGVAMGWLGQVRLAQRLLNGCSTAAQRLLNGCLAAF